MKRTLVHAYIAGDGITDEFKTYINLPPLEAAVSYLNNIIVRSCKQANGEWHEFEMHCTHVCTDGVQEWDGEKWNDITDKEPFAVGAWKTNGYGRYLHIAPYNQGGTFTYFN